MSSYTVSEPHPTVAPSGLTHSGRGGAGNIRLTPSSAKATRPVAVPRPSGRFYTGIGGAGNAHAASERQAVSFEEDFERARAREGVPVVHTGIGGAGNVFRRTSASSESDNSERRSSESSGFWGRISMGSISRH